MTILIKSLDEVSDFERLALSDFSYSRIDTYKSCPSKYFYTYIQKEPRGFAPAAVLRKYSALCARRLYKAR
jgi:hypothetical protein